MLHALHFREVKVAKRSNHGLLLTARRKDGSLELRWAIRIHRGSGAVDRQNHPGLPAGISRTSRPTPHCSSPAAISGARPGRRRCQRRPGPRLGRRGLAEKFLESHSGVRVTSLELFELDPAFFEEAARGAEESRRRRVERHREREEQSEQPEPRPSR